APSTERASVSEPLNVELHTGACLDRAKEVAVEGVGPDLVVVGGLHGGVQGVGHDHPTEHPLVAEPGGCRHAELVAPNGLDLEPLEEFPDDIDHGGSVTGGISGARWRVRSD